MTLPPYEPVAEQPKPRTAPCWMCDQGLTHVGSVCPRTRVCKTYGPSCPTCHPSPAQAVVYGALARAEALAAGHPDWMNVTQWPLDAPQPADNAHTAGGDTR